MPKKQQSPKATYSQSDKDDAAINAVFDMLFKKVAEQKVIVRQAVKSTKFNKT